VSDGLVTYLQKKGAPATAAELAVKVLNLANPPVAAATRLIDALLRDECRAEKVSDGRWQYRPPPSAEVGLYDRSLMLCAMLPTQTRSWREWGTIGVAQYEGKGCRVIYSGQRGSHWHDQQLMGLFSRLIRQPGALFVFNGFGNAISSFQAAMREMTGEECPESIWSLRKLVSRLNGQTISSEESLAAMLGVRHFAEAGIEQILDQLAEELALTLQLLGNRQLICAADVENWLANAKQQVDFSSYGFDRTFLDQLPAVPGVYLMQDHEGKILYVGKSKNLKQRLNSYFQSTADLDEKLTVLRRDVFQIPYHRTGSELQALLLEQELISRLDPPVNRQIQIALRPHRQKSRYERILVVPAVESDAVMVYFLHPLRGLMGYCLYLAGRALAPGDTQFFPQPPAIDAGPQGLHRLEEALGDFFFTVRPAETTITRDPMSEIAFSWLAANEDQVNSIDVRKISRTEECLQQVLTLARHVSVSAEKIIPA